MRVAALYDIHGNLPALEAVLEDIRGADVDQIVVGGDVVPGPIPRETLRRLLDLDLPTHFIHGNGELAILAQMAGTRTGSVTYWGTTSGARPPESIVEIYRWTTAQLQPELEPMLARYWKNSSGKCWQPGDAVWRARCVLAVTGTRYSASPYIVRPRQSRRAHSR